MAIENRDLHLVMRRGKDNALEAQLITTSVQLPDSLPSKKYGQHVQV